jgi:hypothetical protein
MGKQGQKTTSTGDTSQSARSDPGFTTQSWMQAYDANVAALSNGRARPDDIPNEIIKMLPPKLHECIHMMFTLMWATGITPQLEGKPHLPSVQKTRASPRTSQYSQ